jgi:hypothetical protein
MRSLSATFVLCLMHVLPAGTPADDEALERGVAALKKKDYDSAIKILQRP